MQRTLPRRRGLLAATVLAAFVVAAAGPRVAAQPATGLAPAPGAAVKARLAQAKPKDYPTRPIELMVAFGAGGGMDLHARLLQKYLMAYADQQFIVINKAGAAGLVGHVHLATQAKPDGYTLGVVSSNLWADSLQRAEGKWTYKDVEPIAFFNGEPLGWIVTTSGPLKDKSLADIVAVARDKPSTVEVSASENGPTAYLVEQVQRATGAKFNRIAYQGGRQALTDLMGGHIDLSFGYLGEYRALLADGKVRPLAFTATQRTSLLPEVPTFNELLKVDDIVWDAFRFVAAPKGVPADRKAWLEAVFDAVLDDPNLAKEVAALGASMDRRLNTSAKVSEEIDRRIARERIYYERRMPN